MRKTYKAVLKEVFRANLIRTRKDRRLTQSKMAERLMMDDRSYIDLEHGKSCCSALALVLYLIYFCGDIQQFLNDLKVGFEKADDDAA